MKFSSLILLIFNRRPDEKEILLLRETKGEGRRQWIGIDSQRDLVPNNSDWRLRDRSMHRRPTLVKYFKIVADLPLIFWLVSIDVRGGSIDPHVHHTALIFFHSSARVCTIRYPPIDDRYPPTDKLFHLENTMRPCTIQPVERLAATFHTFQAPIESTRR